MLNSLKRYLKLYFYFWKNCLIRDWEFRFNVVIWTFMEFLWFGLFLVSVELAFGQVDSIAGWTKDEVLLLTCVYTLFHDFAWTFVLDNLNRFSEQIRRGNFDFILLKPINPRFHVSTRYFESDHYLKIVAMIILINHFLDRLQIHLSLSSGIIFFCLFFLGLFIIYNLFFIFSTTNIWFINLFNLQELYGSVIDAGRFPVAIFKGNLKHIFIYLIPVAFIATFPTQALMGKIGFEKVFLGILIAIVMFAVSQWFWKFALRRYQSASS